MSSNVLALDVGQKRVGIAIARADVRVPVALKTLDRQDVNFWQNLKEVVTEYATEHIVLGLPRGLDGQETLQTNSAHLFAEELKKHIPLPIHWQDEALTSVKAETVLNNRAKPYEKSDVDALAACYILADYLETEEFAP